jgi:hypothetical protein
MRGEAAAARLLYQMKSYGSSVRVHGLRQCEHTLPEHERHLRSAAQRSIPRQQSRRTYASIIVLKVIADIHSHTLSDVPASRVEQYEGE